MQKLDSKESHDHHEGHKDKRGDERHRSHCDDFEFPHKDKKFKIIVNGRLEIWTKRTISFFEVIELAFGEVSDNPNICYTVTYKRGSGPRPEGSMVKGDVIKVNSRMVFNVSKTDKS